MRKIFLSVLFYLLVNNSSSQAFITTWNTFSANYIIIPGYGTNYNIQWEEIGNPSHNGSKTATDLDTVNFGTAGKYKVSISGGNPAFHRVNFGKVYFFDNYKLTTIEDFGNIQWSSMDSSFYNCELLTTVNGIPNLSNVNSFTYTFWNCKNFNSDVSGWNVSNATNLEGMLAGCKNFNQPLNNWNVSNVINMKSLFYACEQFNQPLNNWNTKNVTNMGDMFSGTSKFNQSLNNWNTNNVINMAGMFSGTSKFNQPLNNWNTNNVINMSSMFSFSAFNQSLSNFNVTSVTDMSFMFYSNYNFNQPINNWNTSNVIKMHAMFEVAYNFNQPINNWDVNNVTDMSSIFDGATSFNQPVTNWNVSNVTNMSHMFAHASSFNQPISNWNTANVTNMSYMFFQNTSFNQNIGNWDVSNVTDMSNMFFGASSFNQPISNWNTANVIKFSNIFNGASNFNQNVGDWNIKQCDNIGIGLSNSGIQYYNYDSIIIKWSLQNKSNLLIMTYGMHYCNSISQRSNAITNKGWQFIGDSYGCTLPITLTSFTATPQENKVLLQWLTASETNNNYFTLQRSSNNDNWQDIATIKGAGNSGITQKYTSTDNNPLQGTNYYRIKQTDFNGSVSYSEIRKVEMDIRQSEISIYPNPAQDIINITCTGMKEIRIVNQLGQVILQQAQNDKNLKLQTLDIKQLPSGIYAIVIETANGIATKKMVKE